VSDGVATRVAAARTLDAVLHQDPAEEVERAIRILRTAAEGESYVPPPVVTRIFVRDNLP
jgi:hypothetical protein